MNKALRVLIIEDSELGALMVVGELKQAGYEVSYKRVETEAAMEDALSNEKWDVVISDYVLPDFSGLAALKLLQKKGIDLPFIIVSGKIGEDVAVEAVKLGAHDYLLKSNLKRLVVSIEREIHEAKNRRKFKEAEDKIVGQKEFLKKVFESISHPFYVIDVKDYTVTMANFIAGFGDLSKAVACYTITHKRDSPCTDEHICPLQEVLKTKRSVLTEHIHYDKDGNKKYVEVHGEPIFDSAGNVVQMIEYAMDISERKKIEEEKIKYVQELEVFYKASVGREERILELKKEIEQFKLDSARKQGEKA